MKNVKYCGGLVLPPKGVHRIICVAEKTSRVSSVSGKDSKNKKIFSRKNLKKIGSYDKSTICRELCLPDLENELRAEDRHSIQITKKHRR